MFIECLKDTLSDEKVKTQNGAVGYKTSGNPILDLNFSTSSLREIGDSDIMCEFMKAFTYCPEVAVKWLFFARDIREGMGERRLFRVISSYLSTYYPEQYMKLINFIPEYGRWDDMIYILRKTANKNIKTHIYNIIKTTLAEDLKTANRGLDKNISMLGKWMPSENASARDTRDMAREISNNIGLTRKEYRKLLSFLRNKIGVVESYMCAKRWSDIDYEHVPSNAGLKYSSAFLRHEEVRYCDYLIGVLNGDKNMNANVLFPHQVVVQYYKHNLDYRESLELMWKNLSRPSSQKKTLVVCDGSRSMEMQCAGSGLKIAQALAIYFSESCVGGFKNKCMTFSKHPQLVDFRNYATLSEKIHTISKYCEVDNTDINAVFELVLRTAINNDMTQDELPEIILIISDMEFDSATSGGVNSSLFDDIGKRFELCGYKIPKLVFWNLSHESSPIPIQKNENGVFLIGGFSPVALELAMSSKTDPFEILMDKLQSDRYKDIKFNL